MSGIITILIIGFIIYSLSNGVNTKENKLNDTIKNDLQKHKKLTPILVNYKFLENKLKNVSHYNDSYATTIVRLDEAIVNEADLVSNLNLLTNFPCSVKNQIRIYILLRTAFAFANEFVKYIPEQDYKDFSLEIFKLFLKLKSSYDYYLTDLKNAKDEINNLNLELKELYNAYVEEFPEILKMSQSFATTSETQQEIKELIEKYQKTYTKI